VTLACAIPIPWKQERRGGIETRQVDCLDLPLHGSRNAVVALKPISLSRLSSTWMRSRNAVVALKPKNSTSSFCSSNGSRNAVVALKLLCDQSEPERPRKKQERRGGIETEELGVQGGRLLAKQERRGGIETLPGQEGPQDDPGEAGTPWWH